MKQIAIRSNKTRAKQRPPLQVSPANAALLARLGFQQANTGPKSPVPKKTVRKKREIKPAALTSTLAEHLPVAQQAPVVPQPPVQAEPIVRLPDQKMPEARSPQMRKYHSNPQPARSPGPDKHIPRRPSAAPGLSDRKSSPAADSIPGSKDRLQSQAPTGQQIPQKPVENKPSAMQQPGSNGISPNGKEPRLRGALRSAGSNGMNGSMPRSSLFRPGAFTSLRIPPKAGSSVQEPPTQIPMEVYTHPDEEPSILPESGKTAAPEIPLAKPLPPNPPQVKATGLSQLLQQNPDLPAQAAIIGVCEDDLPVLLDLHDPAPGALVVIGDERELQLEVLRTAVASIAGRNSARSVQFIVFSCEPHAWQVWAKEEGFDRHCLAVESAEADTVSDWIVRLADWTEQRRLGQSSGPSVLLLMDTLSFLPGLSYDIRLNFEWMAKEGPLAQIWPLAAISTDLAKALSGRRMLRAFQTRVMGYANQPADYIALAGLDQQAAETFGCRGEFNVKVGENWLRFHLPGR